MSNPTEPEGREIRADARDVRQDARDVRADVTATELQDRGVRADVREDVVTEREGTVTGSLRLLKWLIVVLIVISIGNFARTFINQAATDEATTAAEAATAAAKLAEKSSELAEKSSKRAEDISIESRDASLSTLSEFRAIIARYEASNEGDIQGQALIAFQAIVRIEEFICDGKCPEPGG